VSRAAGVQRAARYRHIAPADSAHAPIPSLRQQRVRVTGHTSRKQALGQLLLMLEVGMRPQRSALRRFTVHRVVEARKGRSAKPCEYLLQGYAPVRVASGEEVRLLKSLFNVTRTPAAAPATLVLAYLHFVCLSGWPLPHAAGVTRKFSAPASPTPVRRAVWIGHISYSACHYIGKNRLSHFRSSRACKSEVRERWRPPVDSTRTSCLRNRPACEWLRSAERSCSAETCNLRRSLEM